MKVGDLVKTFQESRGGGRMGMVVKLSEKKVWRTHELGIKVDWSKIDPEPVADVLLDGRVVAGIPFTDLKVMREV